MGKILILLHVLTKSSVNFSEALLTSAGLMLDQLDPQYVCIYVL